MQAIVHAFDLDERTIAEWQKRAGKHCEKVHHAIVEQGNVKSQHIQADEIRARARKMIIWMAFAIDVTTRLWMAGAVSMNRDRKLIDNLFQRVRACCQFVQGGLLVCTDGFAAYKNSIMRAFREKVKKQGGPGRCCLEVWADLCIATVIKRTEKKHVVEVKRKLTRGIAEKAQALLALDKGCKEFNTSFIERLNGTFRERLASLTRKCRHAAARLETLERGMYLVGCTYNFCFPHHELSKTTHFGYRCTPAMAAGLTDHIWSVSELLMYKIAPDSWIEPKRNKRQKQSTSDSAAQKRKKRTTKSPSLPDQTRPKQPGEVFTS
jgi:IS1 family transposase